MRQKEINFKNLKKLNQLKFKIKLIKKEGLFRAGLGHHQERFLQSLPSLSPTRGIQQVPPPKAVHPLSIKGGAVIPDRLCAELMALL